MAPHSDIGKFGGKVLRTFVSGADNLKPGTELSAATVAAWPLRNRKALESTGRVEFYNQGPPQSADENTPPLRSARRGQ